MDTSQLPSILGWLKGAFTKTPDEPQGKTYLASPRLNYPTDEDVDYARKYDYSYGQPWAPEFEGKSGRLLSGDPNQSPLPTRRISNWNEYYGLDPNYYGKAALAAEGSALSKLGFDTNKAAIGRNKLVSGDKVLGGFYAPSTDEMFAYGGEPNALTHESIHRGIERLKGSPYWNPEFDEITKGVMNEYLVRHLMETKMGDPEAALDKPGGISKEQRDDARFLFNQSSNADRRRKIIDKMEEAAANYIAAKRPGGPR